VKGNEVDRHKGLVPLAVTAGEGKSARDLGKKRRSLTSVVSGGRLQGQRTGGRGDDGAGAFEISQRLSEGQKSNSETGRNCKQG